MLKRTVIETISKVKTDMKTQVKVNKVFERKTVNIFLPISINICCGC